MAGSTGCGFGFAAGGCRLIACRKSPEPGRSAVARGADVTAPSRLLSVIACKSAAAPVATAALCEAEAAGSDAGAAATGASAGAVTAAAGCAAGLGWLAAVGETPAGDAATTWGGSPATVDLLRRTITPATKRMLTAAAPKTAMRPKRCAREVEVEIGRPASTTGGGVTLFGRASSGHWHPSARGERFHRQRRCYVSKHLGSIDALV